jgi:hypothetical protein
VAKSDVILGNRSLMRNPIAEILPSFILPRAWAGEKTSG